MKELLGGKGAGLAEMTNLKVSVPPGFTISTEACVEYYKRGKAYPPGMMDEALQALKRVERSMKAGFGDPDNPLLVSVRSGARASMPGMMDTVLNVGLTTKSVHGLALKTKNERFAQDSYRRFIGMFGSIVMGVNREHFEDILKHKKRDLGVTEDTHLDAKASQGTGGPFQGAGQRRDQAGFSGRSARTVAHGDQCRVFILVWRPRRDLSATLRDSRDMGHGRQCRGHGIRQHGGDQRHRCGIHARSGHR